MISKFAQVLVFLIFTFSTVEAQQDYSFKNNYYSTYGSFFGFGNVDLGDFDYGFFDLGFSYGGRYNLYNVSDNFSIGFDIAPEIGFFSGDIGDFGDGGILGLHVPAFISFNFGVGATYDSDKNFGVALKPGLELMTGPMVEIEAREEFKKTALVPVMQLSARFWKRSTNKLREIYLKVGRKSSDREESNGTLIIYFGGAYYIGY